MDAIEREAQEDESLFWADQAAQKLKEKFGFKQVIEDEKTPSGRVHVGALRGVIIHDCLFRAAKDAGLEAKYLYGFDDFDALDKVLPYVPAEYEKYLGVPLCNVPAPDGSTQSYAELYGNEFRESFEDLGAKPEIYWTSKLYRKGLFNSTIKKALEEGARINELDQKISGAQKPSNYLPLKPVCENCGKNATTLASDWDGKTVAYKCADSRDAKGCGHVGRIDPFDGRAKLPWKVEWIAKWTHFGVTCEFAGKDHFTKTGSYTVSAAISREVFSHEPPYGEGYEFILVGKEKMSTSKGTGVVAYDLVKEGDPKILRFFMAKTRPRAQISFEPSSQNLLLLYDEYDKNLAARFAPDAKDERERMQSRRIFEMSAINGQEAEMPLQIPFSLAVTLVQSSKGREIEALQAMKQLPPALTSLQKAHAEYRLNAARKWLANYAPDEYKLSLLQSLDQNVVATLGVAERELLIQAAQKIEEGNASGDELQNFVYNSAKERGIEVKQLFSKAYKLLLGKERGPRLGPFLLSLEKSFAVKRLRLEA